MDEVERSSRRQACRSLQTHTCVHKDRVIPWCLASYAPAYWPAVFSNAWGCSLPPFTNSFRARYLAPDGAAPRQLEERMLLGLATVPWGKERWLASGERKGSCKNLGSPACVACCTGGVKREETFTVQFPGGGKGDWWSGRWLTPQNGVGHLRHPPHLAWGAAGPSS